MKSYDFIKVASEKLTQWNIGS